jgi:hypothetical protein
MMGCLGTTRKMGKMGSETIKDKIFSFVERHAEAAQLHYTASFGTSNLHQHISFQLGNIPAYSSLFAHVFSSSLLSFHLTMSTETH